MRFDRAIVILAAAILIGWGTGAADDEVKIGMIDVELAFSRETDQPKLYVQDRLRSRGEDIARLLEDEHSYLYICGHKRMENGVGAALDEICATHGIDWQSLLPALREVGRYHVETYS